MPGAAAPEELLAYGKAANMDVTGLIDFLTRGGPALWVIAALSVVTLTVILWKIWRLARLGAWRGRTARVAVEQCAAGQWDMARVNVSNPRDIRASLAQAAITARTDAVLPEADAREETTRVAKSLLKDARGGLRMLELIAVIAPLIGLLGTVLGMIEAFQALQESGNQADPSVLAGGIWEALLTTAAGMCVAIPASVALTWFESVIETVQSDMEDAATRIFTAPAPPNVPAVQVV